MPCSDQNHRGQIICVAGPFEEHQRNSSFIHDFSIAPSRALHATTIRGIRAKPFREQTLLVHVPLLAALTVSVCLSAQCLRSMPITGSCFPTPAAGNPPSSKGGPLESAVVSLKIFPRVAFARQPAHAHAPVFYIIYDRCYDRSLRLYFSLICDLHAPVQRLCINDHGRVVLVHGGRQLALGLGQTLADGEHAVDDDGVYSFFYLALRFELN